MKNSTTTGIIGLLCVASYVAAIAVISSHGDPEVRTLENVTRHVAAHGAHAAALFFIAELLLAPFALLLASERTSRTRASSIAFAVMTAAGVAGAIAWLAPFAVAGPLASGITGDRPGALATGMKLLSLYHVGDAIHALLLGGALLTIAIAMRETFSGRVRVVAGLAGIGTAATAIEVFGVNVEPIQYVSGPLLLAWLTCVSVARLRVPAMSISNPAPMLGPQKNEES